MRRSKTRADVGAGIVTAALLFGTPAPPADAAAVPKDTTPRCVTIGEWKAVDYGMRGKKVRRILGLRAVTLRVPLADGTILRVYRPCPKYRTARTTIRTETRKGSAGVWRLRGGHASFYRVRGWTA